MKSLSLSLSHTCILSLLLPSAAPSFSRSFPYTHTVTSSPARTHAHAHSRTRTHAIAPILALTYSDTRMLSLSCEHVQLYGPLGTLNIFAFIHHRTEDTFKRAHDLTRARAGRLIPGSRAACTWQQSLPPGVQIARATPRRRPLRREGYVGAARP